MEKVKKAVGRPAIKNKRKTLTVRVTPEVHEWISQQECSAGAIIEKLALAAKNEQLDMFKNET